MTKKCQNHGPTSLSTAGSYSSRFPGNHTTRLTVEIEKINKHGFPLILMLRSTSKKRFAKQATSQSILDHHIGGIKQRGHILEVMRKTTPNSAVYSSAIIPEGT